MSGLFTSLAVMMSPRGLTAAGNGAGIGGVAFMVLLAVAAFASLYTARSMEALSTGKKRATPFDSFAFGLLDSGRIFTLTVLAVSWLGIAGYAVNEIFFLWFPNLGASFFLLALAFSACLFSSDEGMDMFTICLTLGFAAFIYIAVMATQPLNTGIGYPTSIPAVFSPLVPEAMLQSDLMGWLHLIFLAVLCFIGFDLPLAFENKTRRAIPAIIMILAGFIVFSWGALLLESSEVLSNTFVPYLKVAKVVWGEAGRAVMGGTVVLGTISALVAFFQIAGRLVKGVVAEPFTHHATRGAAAVLTLVIGVLLVTGWAGEDALESLISAGLCFWFGTYALIDLLYLIGKKRAGGGFLSSVVSFVTFLLHGTASGVSALNIEFAMHFYYALGAMFVSGLVFGISYYRKDAPLRAAQAEERVLEGDGESKDDGNNDEVDEKLNIVDYN